MILWRCPQNPIANFEIYFWTNLKTSYKEKGKKSKIIICEILSHTWLAGMYWRDKRGFILGKRLFAKL